MVTPKPPEPKPAVTAEFFPLDDRVMNYDVYVAAPQSGWAYTRQKYNINPDGEILIATILQGTTLVADTTKIPGAVPVNARPTPQKVQTVDGRVEIGTLVDPKTKQFAYEPVLKIGANQGDTWVYPLPGGDEKTYEVIAFSPWGDNVPSVTVRARQPFVAGGSGAEQVTTYVYAKGIGEVERTVKVVIKDKDGAAKDIPQIYVKLHDRN